MRGHRLRKLWGHLNRPLWGTHVCTKDTRVDPTAFPDNEFPLHCRDCGYALRGLPGDRCPECGTEYDRGRRLVEQYVRERTQEFMKRTKLGHFLRLINIVLLTWVFAFVLFSGVVWVWDKFWPKLWGGAPALIVLGPTGNLVGTPVTVFVVSSFAVLFVLHIVFLILNLIALVWLRAKRKRVIEAIDWSHDEQDA